MANYSLVVNSRFKPFSFERYIQPLQIYGQAYKEQEESLNNLEMQANTIEAMINRARDVKAAERYDEYMKGLTAQAEALTTRGLSPAVRSAVNSLRGDYFSKIVPIQKAYETMTKQIEEQRKYGDSRINEYNASELSIDDFLDNPEKSFRTIDRNALYTRSAAAYSAFQNELSDYYLQKDPKIKDNFQKAFVQKYGMRPEEATKFIDDVRTQMNNGVPFDQIVGTNPALMRVFNDLYQGSGVGTWGSRNAEIEAANTILSGAMNSVGKSSINLVTDQAKVLAAQYENARKLAEIKAGKGKNPNIPERLWQQRTFATRRDREEGIQDWKKYKHLFKKDEQGNWHFDHSKFNTTEHVSIGSAPYGPRLDREVPTEEMSFITKYGLGTASLNQAEFNKIVNKYMGLVDDDYDLMGYSEYYRTIDHNDYPNVFDMLSRISQDNKVKAMEYDTDKNGVPQMSEAGKVTLDLKDKTSSDITGARFVESSTGNIYMEVEFKNDANHYAIPIPENVAKEARSRIMEVRDLSSMLNNEDITKNKTIEDLYKMQMDAATYGNESFDILSRFLGTFKTKPIEVKQDESDWSDIMSIING